MSMSRPSCFAILALFASLPACAVQYSDSEDPESLGEEAQPIKGGSLATDYPESVLLLMKVGGQPKELCSGSLIAPRVVITAGHCVHGFDSWSVTAPFANGQTSVTATATTFDWNSGSDNVDPNTHDVALVLLDTPINLASYPTIASSPLSDGSNVVNVGRINNGQLSYTALYKSKPLPISSGASVGYKFDYKANEVIEHGDSGGPVFVPGTHTIVAVNSGGGGGTEILARVDLLHSWILQQVAAHGGSGSGSSSSSSSGSGGQGGGDPSSSSSSSSSGGGGNGPGGPGGPGQPPGWGWPGWGGWPGGSGNYCPGLPPFGQCYGNTLLSCQNGSVHPTSCSALGKVCAFDAQHGHLACM
jgi:uncharacterized membrane protein YgcG